MSEEPSIESLVGPSKAMKAVRLFARKAARVQAPVLILGETGTGKSLLGRVIHRQSPRAHEAYLSVNCAGVPESLFESEFFGHRRGAFTGAREGRRGFLEQAHGGTLFLDELGELTTPQQAKLLTVLEEGEVRRLGAETSTRVNVRVLAATSRDLPREMNRGGFRRDLFHRLAVLTCRIPPLRNRPADILPLAHRFLAKHRIRHGRPGSRLSREASRYLESRPWPGNVRELSHLLEAALILSEGMELDVDILQNAAAMAEEGAVSVGEEEEGGAEDPTRASGSPGRGTEGSERVSRQRGSRRYTFLGTQEEERELIRAALVRARGNRTVAARDLGMARNTLRQKLRKHDLA